MKEILAKILRLLKAIKVRFICLFKLTFRLGDKEDDNKGGTIDE